MGEDRKQYMVTSEGWLIDAQSGAIISKEPGAVPQNMGTDDIFRTQDAQMPIYSQSYGNNPSQLADYTTRNTPAPAAPAPAPVQEPRFTQGQKQAFFQNNAGNFGFGGQGDQFRYDPYGQNPKTPKPPGTQAAIVKSLMRGR